MINYKDQEGLQALIEPEYSTWSEPLKITQEMINDFAELTGDKLWIHTDPEKCKENGMGSTIAHGFLVLSLLSNMRAGSDIAAEITGYKQIMNYGSDKLRFMAPVPVNSEIHARRRVLSIAVAEKKTKATLEWEISVLGNDRPNVVYHMSLVFF